MKSILVTGGAGFFGGILLRRLLAEGYDCVSIDLVAHELEHPHLQSIRGDIRDPHTLKQIFSARPFAAVFHCAAILAHAVKDRHFLWSSNVDGTRHVADLARQYRIPKLVFTSSNCLWGTRVGRPIREDDTPAPVEIYGRSKWAAEQVLQEFTRDLDVVILRCPTIIDAGRLGLLSILFEFIAEGRRVWVVGGGTNRYQFIFAPDLVAACRQALAYDGSGVFHVGADDVKPLAAVYQYVIDRAGTGARVTTLPRWPTLPLMRLAHGLKLSPLGPYQYRMIAEDFAFDTGHAKRELGWSPTCSNEAMLWEAYRYFRDHRDEIESRHAASAHRQPAKMGIIRLLKWIS